MEIILYQGGMCYLVWDNTIMELVSWVGWLKSNRYLGESEVWRLQSRIWWTNTPCHKKDI